MQSKVAESIKTVDKAGSKAMKYKDLSKAETEAHSVAKEMVCGCERVFTCLCVYVCHYVYVCLFANIMLMHYYSPRELSCRDNFSRYVNKLAHQHSEL